MKNPKKKLKGTGNVDKIAEDLINPEDLKQKLAKANELVTAQDETIQKLNNEIEKLQESLAKKLEVPQSTQNFLEDERIIADIQLKKLKEVALTRSLTLEETRKFEIFSKIKNQDSNLGKSGKFNGNLPRDVTSRTLLSIASSGIDKKTEE